MSPVYQFECIGCHETREVTASIHDSIPEQICNDGYAMMRIYSPFGVSFKSNGFYSTDNR
jgi:predicted nucleic acid-binding Zn ribbon protein